VPSGQASKEVWGYAPHKILKFGGSELTHALPELSRDKDSQGSATNQKACVLLKLNLTTHRCFISQKVGSTEIEDASILASNWYLMRTLIHMPLIFYTMEINHLSRPFWKQGISMGLQWHI